MLLLSRDRVYWATDADGLIAEICGAGNPAGNPACIRLLAGFHGWRLQPGLNSLVRPPESTARWRRYFIRAHPCGSVAQKSLFYEFAMLRIQSDLGAWKLATDAHGCTQITLDGRRQSRSFRVLRQAASTLFHHSRGRGASSQHPSNFASASELFARTCTVRLRSRLSSKRGIS